MGFWWKIIAVVSTVVGGAILTYEQAKIQVVKVETEKIIKEVVNSYPTEIMCLVAAIVLIAFLLTVECIYQAYARRQRGLKKFITQRAENAVNAISA